MMDFTLRVLPWASLVLLFLALCSLGVSVWQDSNSPTFELKKNDWQCIKEESRTHLQPMPVGKVTVMQPMTSTVCLEYRRIRG